jgi:protocatechuate 3,4-dioxygenase beta subunit
VIRKLVTLAAVLMLCSVISGQFALAAEQPTTRTLTGQVTNTKDAPLPDAVVYLKNTKTLAVRTFITDKGGNYRFTSLSPNVDYEVYAEQNGSKGDTKTLSAFDSRKTAIINLRVDAK